MEAYLDKIETSSKVLLGIINDVLDMYDWDYVMLQGTTHNGQYDNAFWGKKYLTGEAVDSEPYWAGIRDAVAEKVPDAKRLVHATGQHTKRRRQPLTVKSLQTECPMQEVRSRQELLKEHSLVQIYTPPKNVQMARENISPQPLRLIIS